MATIVNMHQAKSQLSKLVEKVLAGEEVIVARAGKPAVRLIAIEGAAEAAPPEKKLRPIGGLEGKVWIAEDFNDPLPEDLLAEFYKDDLDLHLIARPREEPAAQHQPAPSDRDRAVGE